MSAWSHIIVEGYCLFGSLSEKRWEGVPLDGRGKKSIMENKNYTPRTKRSKWCKKKNKKRTPQFRCLCDKNDERCPFFGMVNVSKKEYRIFFEGWEKMVQKENKEMDKKHEKAQKK